MKDKHYNNAFKELLHIYEDINSEDYRMLSVKIKSVVRRLYKSVLYTFDVDYEIIESEDRDLLNLALREEYIKIVEDIFGDYCAFTSMECLNNSQLNYLLTEMYSILDNVNDYRNDNHLPCNSIVIVYPD